MIYWIYKGTSDFYSELQYDIETDQMVKNNPDGFYDIISESDTINGGLKVIEYSEYERLELAIKTTLPGVIWMCSKCGYFVESGKEYLMCERENEIK